MDESQSTQPEMAQTSESGINAPVALAIIAVLSSVLNITVSSSGGLDFGISILGAFISGSGTAYTVFALIWDVLFVGATVLCLVGMIVGRKNPSRARTLIIAALSLCICIIALDLLFVVIVNGAGLKSFSLYEMMIIYSFGSDVNLVTQFVLYVGALVVFIAATKTRKPMVAIIGFAIVAVFALVLTVCGLQPFAYSVGGITVFGQSIPRVSTYCITEFVAMACMWASMAAFIVKSMPREAKTDDVVEEK